jgi:hypothetical protein
VQVKWFLGCRTEEDKESRRQLIYNNKPALDILLKICYNSIRELESSSEDFSNSNWAIQEAARAGERKALKQIIKMCNLDKEPIDHNG